MSVENITDKHPYTPEKIDKAIDSIEALLVHHAKQKQNFLQLIYSLTRIKRAMSPTFWLNDMLKEEIKFQQKILDNTVGGGNSVTRAKKVILDKEGRFYSKETAWERESVWHRWDTFKFYKKSQWEKDREKKIWEK